MALTQGFDQPGVLHGPQWRQARLNGASMAVTEVTGGQLLAGTGRRRPGTADTLHALGGWTS